MVNAMVIDCSVSTAWLMPDETSPHAERLLTFLLKREQAHLIQPSLWLYETVNCLRTAVLRQRLTSSDAKSALYYLQELPIELVPPEKQGEFQILDKAIDHQLSAYDAAYLELAETRGVNLFTGDRDLIRLKRTYPFIHDIREF